MEVLYREIKSSIGIKLKTIPQQLISKARLEKRLKTGSRKSLEIVITVGSKEDALKLCANGRKFGGAPKVVEKYWEVRPSFVNMTCSGIGYD